MANYIDLVLCKRNGKRYLYQAPAWSGLNAGDSVVVALSNETADVIAVMTVADDVENESYAFALAATESDYPLRKVIGRILVSEFSYKDYDEGEEK